LITSGATNASMKLTKRDLANCLQNSKKKNETAALSSLD